MDAYLGEVRAVGFNFAPRGWALCAGQILPISSNTALFSLLGTTYGGDGRTTFALPNLCGQGIVQIGQGPGLSPYVAGQVTGTENVTLDSTQMPAHVHTLGGAFQAQGTEGTEQSPSGYLPAMTVEFQYSEGKGSGTMGANMIKGTAGEAGSNQAHNNMMPSLTMNYIICTSGIFPPRS